MALFDKLKDNVLKSKGTLKQTVLDVSEKLPDSVKDLKDNESVKKFAQKGQETLNALKEKGEEALAAHKEKSERSKTAVSEAMQKTDRKGIIFPVQDALRIIFCLMAVDGSINPEEEKTVCEIGEKLDPNFSSYKDKFMDEGKKLAAASAADEEEHYDIIHDAAGEILLKASQNGTEGISGKTLVWDLLTVAYSEGDYTEPEKRLIRYISRAVGVDTVVLQEMKQTLQTLLAIDKENTWLRSTDRPYAFVDERVQELIERRDAILKGMEALLLD